MMNEIKYRAIPYPMPEPFLTQLRKAGAMAVHAIDNYGQDSDEHKACDYEVDQILMAARAQVGEDVTIQLSVKDDNSIS